MASQAVWETSCLARLVFAPCPERNARNSKPRNLAAFWLLQCFNVKQDRLRGFARDKVSASPRGGGRQCLRSDTLSPHGTGGGVGWGHCVLEHTAGPLSDKGGGVQCPLPRIIPTNKLDTNTCQNEVKHVGEQTKKQRSCIDAIRNWMRL